MFRKAFSSLIIIFALSISMIAAKFGLTIGPYISDMLVLAGARIKPGA